MEEALVRTCADFHIPTTRIPKLTGVWTTTDPLDPKSKDPAKIAAIGIHISRAVTSHGFALNVNTDLSSFELIIPCGLTTKPVTSMAKELGAPVSLDRVAESVTRNFGHIFGQQILWVETLDALLGNTVGIPAKPPTNLRKLHGEDETFWA